MRIYLENKSPCSVTERRVNDLTIAMGCQKHDFHGGDGLADSTGCVYSTEQRKSDVEQDHVWLGLRSFVNRIQPVQGFAHNLPLPPLSQQCASEFSPRMEIICQQNAT